MSNTFGDDLKDNLKFEKPRTTTYTSNFDNKYKDKYNLVTHERILKPECSFRLLHSGNYYANRRYIVYRDSSRTPNVFWWEGKEVSEKADSLYKFGPWDSLEETYAHIRAVLKAGENELERVV